MRPANTLFDESRTSFEDAMELTAKSLTAYASSYPHWAVAFSGGKDSSATASVICHLIKTGRVPAPKSLTILRSDTRMELPPLESAAEDLMVSFRAQGHRAWTVMPPMDERFFVYMLGRGVPPPKNRFRWCTSQLKINPMIAALKGLRDEAGEKLLMLTGVRLGESAQRDSRIQLSCGRDNAECGQGWFQISTPDAVADTLAPLLHWRVCFVWDWLFWEAPRLGYPTAAVAEAYSLPSSGDIAEREEVHARTGCVGCNLASRDLALDNIVCQSKWSHLAPLKELKPLYRELQLPQWRLRKDGTERRKDGSLVSNPCRMGPLTMEARRMALAKVLDIQARAGVSLVNAEEEARIIELIAVNTWPDRWTGYEPKAHLPFDNVFPDGSVQPLLI